MSKAWIRRSETDKFDFASIEVLEIESDRSQHGILVNSSVIMPENAPEQTPSVCVAPNLLSGQSSPITAPSSAVTMSDGASSDGSSAGSASLVGQTDSDWDEIEVAPPLAITMGEDEIEYQVLYDSASEA